MDTVDSIRWGAGPSRALLLAVAATAASVAAMFIGVGSAQAEVTSVLGGAVPCTEQPDGVRHCGSNAPRSTVETFDGVPIDVNVALPAEPASGPDGDYPLIMMFHGYGGGKLSFGSMSDWLEEGYAVFSMTDRGFRESCGSPASKAADPAGCENGYVRLIDNRYEVRDAQLFAGMLADEGLIAPDRIGATGGSYGGGMSLALAALRDRMVLEDGSLVPWRSPGGRPMELAAATPFITWSDLAYSLVPNGSTLDYLVDNPYGGRYGVMKESLVSGLYFAGQLAPGFYAPEGSDPTADLTGWRNRLMAGEPYDGDPQAQQILDEIVGNHSAYYIDDSVPPAPLLLANGFTDDLFPVDEMVRFYNRTRAEHPEAKISLFAAEIAGHPRSQGKSDAREVLNHRAERWMHHFVKGEGTEPVQMVEAFTQTCPADADSGGPFRADSWARIAPGEVSAKGGEAQLVEPGGGSKAIAAAFNPVTGGGACVRTDASDQPGTANYRTAPAPEGGYTLLGSPFVTAEFDFDDPNSQVAARLLDVAPDGMQTLIARGLWRPEPGRGGRQAFQLHPGAWTFEQGHVAKLELLAADADGGGFGSYGRPSDGQEPVEISRLALRLPVVERPGSSGGFVDATGRKPVPEGNDLAPGFERLFRARARVAKGPLRRRGRNLHAQVKCPTLFAGCTDGEIVVKGREGGSSFRLADGEFEAAGGSRSAVRMKLSKRGHRWLKRHEGSRVRVKTSSGERRGVARQKRRVRS